MKIKIISYVFLISFSFFSTSQHADPQNFLNYNLSLNTTNTWCEFNLDSDNLTRNSAWIGLITFKSKSAIQLKKINLQWSGEFINAKNISASLYQKKELCNDLIPIEENLVCDGRWNKESQQIIFQLNEKLVAINKYYLVLNFPDKVKSNLKSGSFVLSKNDDLQLFNLK